MTSQLNRWNGRNQKWGSLKPSFLLRTPFRNDRGMKGSRKVKLLRTNSSSVGINFSGAELPYLWTCDYLRATRPISRDGKPSVIKFTRALSQCIRRIGAWSAIARTYQDINRGGRSGYDARRATCVRDFDDVLGTAADDEASARTASRLGVGNSVSLNLFRSSIFGLVKSIYEASRPSITSDDIPASIKPVRIESRS